MEVVILLMTCLQKYVMSETKEVNVKVFNMITRINEIKILMKHISCNFKRIFNSTTCNSNQKSNSDNKVSVKSTAHTKKITVTIPAHVFVRIAGI